MSSGNDLEDSGEPQYEILQNMQAQPMSSSSDGGMNGMDNQGYHTYYQNDVNNMIQSSSTIQIQPPITEYSYQQPQQPQFLPPEAKNIGPPVGPTEPRFTPPNQNPNQNKPDHSDRVDPPNPHLAKAYGVYLDQERFLPIANVARTMKNQIDPAGKLSKDAKECVQECVSEFISFISSEAAAHCMETKKKTITADDMLTALEATGFDNYAEPMRVLLMKYRQAHKLAGPIHRIHPNYVRPVQFRNDPPFQPLFFYTANGRKCTEMNFFNSSGDIIRNDFQRDPLNEAINRQIPDETEPDIVIEQDNRHQVHQNAPIAPTPPETSRRPIVIEEEQIEQQELIMERGTGIIRMANTPTDEPSDEFIVRDGNQPIAALQHNQMQIYVDSISKQHYAAIEGPNGVKLWPIKIVGAPISLTNAPPIDGSDGGSGGDGDGQQSSYMYVDGEDGVGGTNGVGSEEPEYHQSIPETKVVATAPRKKAAGRKNYEQSTSLSSDQTDAPNGRHQFDNHVDMEQGELEEFIVPNNKKRQQPPPAAPQPRITRSQLRDEQKVPTPTRMATRKSARRS